MSNSHEQLPKTCDEASSSAAAVVVGCAGWSIPKSFAPDFPASGSHLERYAARLNGVEINSSFYRPHQIQTYTKWSACVPEAFRFAVKVPKSITHQSRLQETSELLNTFLAQVTGLGDKLGPLLEPIRITRPVERQ